jgi:hypothetical protein
MDGMVRELARRGEGIGSAGRESEKARREKLEGARKMKAGGMTIGRTEKYIGPSRRETGEP